MEQDASIELPPGVVGGCDVILDFGKGFPPGVFVFFGFPLGVLGFSAFFPLGVFGDLVLCPTKNGRKTRWKTFA